jgi:RNA polymerase sigma-70 factor (ECF subfamily)
LDGPTKIIVNGTQGQRFERLLAAHLDAAWNLARWLTQDSQDADDCVQDASLRAWRFFDGFRGGDERAWLLAIVRNSCYSFLQRKRSLAGLLEYNVDIDSLHQQEGADLPSESETPEMQLLRQADAKRIETAIQALPPEYREVLVLREMEDLPYKQIADIAGIPIGTVMSRLARARAQLRRQLQPETSR